jgi:YbbR domain-containing protein
MPFQDIDETDATPIRRSPTAPERWLRKVIFEDWGLKLLALTITVVLWLAVTGQNKPVTLRVSGVQLNFLRPEGLEISNEPPGTVDVILTGSKDKIDRIGPRDLIATVDLTDQKGGERVVRLSPDRVKMDLREDVKIQGFQPATIPIRLERSLEAAVEVEVKFEGKLPEGYEVVGVSVEPARVRLRGPYDRIAALRQVMTETVWLDGKTASFSLSGVAINIADPKIEVLDAAVDLHVQIAPKKRSEVQLRLATAEVSIIAGMIAPAYRQ